MAADITQIKQNYVVGLQAAAKLVVQLNAVMNNLNALYVGGGLSGTFVDGELANASVTKHLVAADIGTYTANLGTIQTAISSAILQNMAKAVGTPV